MNTITIIIIIIITTTSMMMMMIIIIIVIRLHNCDLTVIAVQRFLFVTYIIVEI